ncbi:type II-A CRISPR-associated protein Csn2 [Streptococcus constellatus]|uniref:CRISPR type II-A/NMEMI-associated protein Csn2 n=1 Tax=Streptococcus constellatus subsp. constellatus SK53 TaxID=1095730 RepID=A0AAD2SWK2_STRCV|nr:type II-A CRISPR-associated protein Csn2 [Streptococcus constellatus]EID22050.1 CRISPR type II-A/NMEMI-associated protein Csn2 [Streptococcus constellatus subsp. constellatus SK53]MDP1484580.1 type II-A CRISPR-associated protein Csn2 [Streptococcus constellatus]QQT06293.1 type II-A CRISPR-associated protein Csn2 [Streptococcus constellatus]SUN40880.1 CRISPR-associated protein, SAG0897 family [Streptococcus constellatus]BBD22962.1 CRISPR-associated protein [Streptococcus constellatus subsp. 
MKINFPILDEPIEIKQATFLILEEQLIFSDVVKHLYHYSEEDELKLFDNKMKSLKESELLLITDILGYNINSPAMLKLIRADLEKQLNEKPEVKSMLEKLVATITELIAFECLENELDLEYDEITILELIDALGVKIETLSDTVFEKSLEVVQVFKYLSKKKLLVFVNVSCYLSEHKLAKLVEYIQLHNINVLFVEPRKVYDFPQYVVDEDYFLSCENMV